MTSATPAAAVPGQSTELTKERELGDSALMLGGPHVAAMVSEANKSPHGNTGIPCGKLHSVRRPRALIQHG